MDSYLVTRGTPDISPTLGSPGGSREVPTTYSRLGRYLARIAVLKLTGNVCAAKGPLSRALVSRGPSLPRGYKTVIKNKDNGTENIDP